MNQIISYFTTKIQMTAGYAALLFVLLSTSVIGQTDSTSTSTSTETPTIDTPFVELIKNEEAKLIVSKYLENLVKAFEEDWDVQDYFFDASLRELSIDDNHVKGFTQEMLNKIEAELIVLQTNNSSA